MEVQKMLDELQKQAEKDSQLRERLLRTQTEASPLQAFCKICREQGYSLYPMDLISAGEEFYAAIRRSTNGGGENSPKLEGEDDLYEMFLAALAGQAHAEGRF